MDEYTFLAEKFGGFGGYQREKSLFSPQITGAFSAGCTKFSGFFCGSAAVPKFGKIWAFHRKRLQICHFFMVAQGIFTEKPPLSVIDPTGKISFEIWLPTLQMQQIFVHLHQDFKKIGGLT